MLSNGILFSHKELSCAIYMDMNGPRDCHTELRKSEREKKIYRIILLIYAIQKNHTDELTCKAEIETIENVHMDTGWKGVEMNWKFATDTYTLLCITQITKENLLHSTQNSTQSSVVT